MTVGAQRFGRFILGDLWLVENDRPLGLVRFQEEIPSGDQRALLAFDKDLDWADRIRSWWLVGGTDHLGHYGRHGGRLACVECSRAFHVWQPGKLLGIECVTKHTAPADLDACRQISVKRWGAERTSTDPRAPTGRGDPMGVARSIAEAKRRQQFGTRHSNLQDKQRGRARYHAERERLAQERAAPQDFVGRPSGGREPPVRGRNRHAREQARPDQQTRAKSPELERLEQEQCDWADYWTSERERQARARAHRTAEGGDDD